MTITRTKKTVGQRLTVFILSKIFKNFDSVYYLITLQVLVVPSL